jgi:hypothetical protein
MPRTKERKQNKKKCQKKNTKNKKGKIKKISYSPRQKQIERSSYFLSSFVFLGFLSLASSVLGILVLLLQTLSTNTIYKAVS